MPERVLVTELDTHHVFPAAELELVDLETTLKKIVSEKIDKILTGEAWAGC